MPLHGIRNLPPNPTGRLMSFSSEVKAHLAEPVITAAIQNRLLSSDAMRFTSDLVSCTSLKARWLFLPHSIPH